jgi:hypothetical protein
MSSTCSSVVRRVGILAQSEKPLRPSPPTYTICFRNRPQ